MMLTFGSVTVYTVVEVKSLGNSLNRLQTTLIPLEPAIKGLRADIRKIGIVTYLEDPESLLRASRHLTEVDETPDQFAERLTQIRERLRKRQDASGAQPLVDQFQDIDTLAVRFLGDLKTFLDAVENGDDVVRQRRELKRQISTLSKLTEQFQDELQKALERSTDTFDRDEDQVAWAAVLMAWVALIIGVLIIYSAYRLLRPLRALKEGVSRVAEGKYDQPVQTTDQGELGALATEFNRMAEVIRRRDLQVQEQQQALLQREQLATVGRMSAQITHELRNPLSSIGLNSELLMEELEQDSQTAPKLTGARDLLQNIIAEVERLKEITEDYLRFARLPIPERSLVDLNHTAAELLEFVRSEMERAQVKTRLDKDPSPTPAYVDPNQVRAALLNLLRNAREAMPDGGHIVVRIRSLSGGVTVEVKDSGPGIKPELLPRLYEPFFSTKPQGTGLGLSMVREIMEAHEGAIRVDMPASGGTLFGLTFPSSPPLDAGMGGDSALGQRRENTQ